MQHHQTGRPAAAAGPSSSTSGSTVINRSKAVKGRPDETRMAATAAASSSSSSLTAEAGHHHHHHNNNNNTIKTGAAASAAMNEFKTKTVLKEAVDAVVSSFAKHSQGYGRGESSLLIYFLSVTDRNTTGDIQPARITFPSNWSRSSGID